MKRNEFFEKLQSLYPKIPDKQGLREYSNKLIKWKVSGKTLDELYEIITEKHIYFPTIAEFMDCAATAGIAVKRKPKDCSWLAFDINGTRYYKKGNPGDTFPENSKNQRNVIPPELQYIEPCSRAEARAAFLEGFRQTCTDNQKADKILFALQKADLDNEQIPF